MNIVTNLPRVTFFFYLFYIYYSYVRPVPEASIVIDVAGVITDYGTFPHIPTFFKCPYYYGLYQKKIDTIE